MSGKKRDGNKGRKITNGKAAATVKPEEDAGITNAP